MSSTTVTRGNILEAFVIAPSITPTVLTTASTQSLQSFPISGLKASDIVYFMQYGGTQTKDIAITNCDITAENSLTVQFQNTSGGATAITPAAGTYYFKVVRPDGTPIATNAA